MMINIDINQEHSETILLFKNLRNYVRTHHSFNIELF